MTSKQVQYVDGLMEVTIPSQTYRLTIRDETSFDIVVAEDSADEISQAIIRNTFSFSDEFHFIFDLIQPNDNILDLGAFIGTFSLAAAALGGNVVSVDASPYNAALLKASVAENNFSQMNVVSAAVSNQIGNLEFIQGGPYGLVNNPSYDTIVTTVPAITIDNLLSDLGWDRVDILKLDVEGFEVLALKGMSQLLARDDAPLVLYESNGHTLNLFGFSPNHLLAEWEKFGYKNYYIQGGRLIPIHSKDLQTRCNVDCFAAKCMPSDLGNWVIGSSLSDEEKISQILASCVADHEHLRMYIGRALVQAPISILKDERIINALDNLNKDQVVAVREAVSWWKEIQAKIASKLSRMQGFIDQESELISLRELVSRYEQGLFIRTMRILHNFKNKLRRSV